MDLPAHEMETWALCAHQYLDHTRLHGLPVDKHALEQAKLTGSFIDAVVRPLEEWFCPIRILKGGSQAKKTAVEGSDIDIVVVLEDFDHNRMEEYVGNAIEALSQEHSNGEAVEVKAKERRTTAFGFKISLRILQNTRDFDVLFTGDPYNNSHMAPESYFRSFYTFEQTHYVKSMKAKYPNLHHTIVQMKTTAARGLQSSRGFGPPAPLEIKGYFLELAAITHFEECGNANATEVAQRQIRELRIRSFTCPATGAIIGACSGTPRGAVNAENELEKLCLHLGCESVSPGIPATQYRMTSEYRPTNPGKPTTPYGVRQGPYSLRQV